MTAEFRDIRTLRIHAEVGNDKVCPCEVCGGICCTTVCDQVVAHHVERCFGRICTDTLGSDAVVGAGDDNTCLRGRWMTFAPHADIAKEGIAEPSEVHICLCCQLGSNSLANFRGGHIDGCYCAFEKIHARAFSFSMRFRESPMRPRSSSMLMIMTSRASPTESTSSG